MAKDVWERIAKEQYGLWKNNPVTLAIHEYYADYASSLAENMMMRWREGVITLDQEKEARGYINALADILAVDHSIITGFYGIENESRNNDEESDAA